MPTRRAGAIRAEGGDLLGRDSGGSSRRGRTGGDRWTGGWRLGQTSRKGGQGVEWGWGDKGVGRTTLQRQSPRKGPTDVIYASLAGQQIERSTVEKETGMPRNRQQGTRYLTRTVYPAEDH